jgi:glycosyltransferase involved in cell wall biosynthesis
MSLVLDALRAQSLPIEQWELLLIDNASEERLEQGWDLRWHPHARHVREDKLGLTPARLRGISEAKGDLAVFVDDDNVVEADYLSQAVAIANEWPALGAWGGQITASFHETPEEWTRPFLGLLAIRELRKDIWSNSKHAFDAMPCGAGMVVRSGVSHGYKKKVENDPIRATLGRKGSDLASCEDADLAYTAIDLGYGFGVFRALRLTHLIPKERLSEEYLVRLVERMTFSSTLLDAVHQNDHGTGIPGKTGFTRLAELFRDSRARKLLLARRRGEKMAAKLLAEQTEATRKTIHADLHHNSVL